MMRNRFISPALALLLATLASRGHAQAGRLPPEEPGVPPDVLRTLTGDEVFAHTISDAWVQPLADASR